VVIGAVVALSDPLAWFEETYGGANQLVASQFDTVGELPKNDERSDVELVGALSGACGARFNSSRSIGINLTRWVRMIRRGEGG